ncbi:hypothetical protein ASF04_23765 [Duganella sp. Leaf61]|nr:hypothetical protein ASF04_23765 [Duganella sp. Leaf61]
MHPKPSAFLNAQKEVERMEALLRPYGGLKAVHEAIEAEKFRSQLMLNSPTALSSMREELARIQNLTPAIKDLPVPPIPQDDILVLQRRIHSAEKSEDIEELKEEIISLKALVRKLISRNDDSE